jgi:membrane-associated phospholipid phosphatase
LRVLREFQEKRIVVESFVVFLGVLGVLLPFEFAFFTWQKAYVASGGVLNYPETFLDAYIPFVPEFIWPYWLYFVLLASSVWLPKNRHELARQAGGMLLIHFAGFIAYFMYPSAMQRIELGGCDTLSCTATGAMYLLDPGYGVFPSLHVALSVYMVGAFFAFRHPARWFIALFGLSICMSTVLVKQHYLIDIPAGFLLGFFGRTWAWNLIDRIYARASDQLPGLFPAGDREGLSP